MENLELYNNVRKVPKTAQKPIAAGRLKGMTDINPMWRIQELTNQFGICGIGWSYEIVRQWIEEGSNGERAAFTNINLFVKVDGEWSRSIPGTGGSSFIAKESKGMHTSDECYKMSLTDAISVACKALGFGADIYWQDGRSKYSNDNLDDTSNKITTQMLTNIAKQKGFSEAALCKKYVVKEVKFIKQDKKKEAYEGFERLPDKK